MECEPSVSSECAVFSESASVVQDTSEISETPSTVSIDTSATSASEQLSPEFLQRKLYFLLEHLKKMHSELPE